MSKPRSQIVGSVAWWWCFG